MMFSLYSMMWSLSLHTVLFGIKVSNFTRTPADLTRINMLFVAEVLKFYITEVVIRQSQDEEFCMPQNRQVQSDCICNTHKYCIV